MLRSRHLSVLEYCPSRRELASFASGAPGTARTLAYSEGVNSFSARLASAVEEKGAPLCVGIDPDPALMPAGLSLTEFCRGIVDAVAPTAAVVKIGRAHV